MKIKTDIILNRTEKSHKKMKSSEDTYNILVKELVNNKKELIDIKHLLTGNKKIINSLKIENYDLIERLSHVESQIVIREFSD